MFELSDTRRCLLAQKDMLRFRLKFLNQRISLTDLLRTYIFFFFGKKDIPTLLFLLLSKSAAAIAKADIVLIDPPGKETEYEEDKPNNNSSPGPLLSRQSCFVPIYSYQGKQSHRECQEDQPSPNPTGGVAPMAKFTQGVGKQQYCCQE